MTMKRALSMLLTLAMVLSFGVLPAAAEDLEIVDVNEPAQEIDEVNYPAQQFSYYEPNGLSIDVKAPAGALPRGTTMEVSRLADLSRVQNAVDRASDLEGSVVLAADINFWHDGEEIEPVEGNKILVTMTAPEIAELSNPVVVHVPDEEPAVAERIDPMPNDDLENLQMADQVSFEAESFSVYAVIGSGETGDDARLFVTFVQASGSTTIPVKKSDLKTDALFEMVLYDPGVGELSGRQSFFGWTTTQNYTLADKENALTIAQVRSAVRTMLNNGVTEGQTLTYYAMIMDVYNVTYLDEDGAVIKTDPVLVKTGSPYEYTVNEDYDPKDTDSRFEGWGVASQDAEGKWVLPDEASMTMYQKGAKITFGTGSGQMNNDLVLRAFVPKGHWLIFKENGQGASFTPPAFYRSNETTKAPSTTPTRFGYTFGGWYLDKDCTTAFTFNQTLAATTRVYAKWNAATTANYTVIIWTENITCDGYDFKEVVTVQNAEVNSNTNVTGNANAASVSVNGTNKSYTGFHLKEAPTNVKVTPEGNAVVNVYFDRNEYTFTFQVEDYTYTVSENDNDNNPNKYGVVNNEHVRVYWNNGAFRTSNYSWGTVYNGTVYTRSNSQSVHTIHTVTKKYDEEITGIWNFTGSDGITYPVSGNNTTSWTPQNSNTYTARITAMQRMPAENITWLHTPTNKTPRVFHYYIEVAEGETGTRSFQNRQYKVYKDLDNDFNYVYYNDDFWILKGFDRQAIAKDNGDVVDLSANQAIGWDASTYNEGTGTRTLNGTYGGTDSHLYFYYTRQQYKITYMDGKFVDGDGTEITEGVTDRAAFHWSEWIDYEADISSYGDPDSDDYYSAEDETPQGFVLGGWYMDKSCTVKYPFDKMPLDGAKVYAKWIRIQYRVFLYPNATDKNQTGVGTNDLSFESGEQSTCFRIDYGEELSFGSVPVRDEYEFNGWYTDPSLASQYAFSVDSFTAKDEMVPKAYDRTEPTERNYYGDPTDTINKDDAEHNDRFWITHKLELYIKWRHKLIGTDGIVVQYLSGSDGVFTGGSTEFIDPLHYEDDADASAQGAPTATTEGMEFKCWVLQVWNGSEFVPTTTKVNPGELFKIDATTAYIVDNETGEQATLGNLNKDHTYTYTIQLVAEYGSIEAPTPTHIDFYANNGSGDVQEYNPVLINVGVAIPTPSNYTPTGKKAGGLSFADHVFLGWARIETGPDAGGTQIREFSSSDLFLKWVPDNSTDGGHYVADINGTWKTVTDVAADEYTPYHDLYAVWAKVFYIYHTGTNEVEKIVIDSATVTTETNGETTTTTHTPLTFDLASRTADGFLYGGYYTDYAGKSNNFDAKTIAETSWTAGSETAATSANALKLFTYTDSNCTAYDGTNATWTSIDPYTDRADQLAPVAGTTYYLKEVPAAKYLRPQLRYTFFENEEGSIANIWLITNIDDTTYLKSGLVVAGGLIPGTVTDSLTITPRNKPTNAKEHTSQSLFKTAGKLCYLEVMAIDKPQQSGLDGDFLQLLQPGQEVLQYWVTPDGMKVTGTVMRAYKGLYTTSSIGLADTYPKDVASTIVYVGRS